MMMATIGSNDVLCGRGGATNNHPGNKRFRAIVAHHMSEYLAARKKEKAIIARQIVDHIKAQGGRFLKRSDGDKTWIEVSDKKATEKTSQALREGLDVRHKTYRLEKIARRDSDTSEENPRKRTRLVTGTVLDDSPLMRGGLQSSSFGSSMMENRDYTSIPELTSEDYPPAKFRSPKEERLMQLFDPPRITKTDCDRVVGL
mmetsp:Transcript_111939/g.321609  ORF Transcript_111939/g.321609 Transcript_111939/m.321609 type:complete len:201 (-) Transcript_111939:71-673(-)